MKKRNPLIIKAVLAVMLSLCVLAGGMVHIFASDVETQPVDNQDITPQVPAFEAESETADTTPPPTPVTPPSSSEADGNDTVDPSSPSEEPGKTETPDDVIISDISKPVSQEQLEAKFAGYTHVSEENGKKVVTLYTQDQIAEINARRAAGEIMLLNTTELLYLLDDTKHLFEEYDIIRVNGLDGAIYSYPGVSFYASEEFDSAFSNKIGTVSNELSYDLRSDAYEAMLFRIHVLHSYAEYISYREDIECMYLYTEWDGVQGVDPRVLAEGTVERYQIYSGRFNIAKNFMEGDTGDDNGKHPEIAQARLNAVRSIPGAMLVFDACGDQIYYLSDMSEFDGTNMVTLYPNGIFPGGTVLGKYENSTEKAVVIELWEEASASCIARIRLTEKDNPTEVQKIAELWNGMKDIETRGGNCRVGKGNYRVAVYLCGFECGTNTSGVEKDCFWYTPDADTDLWSLIWWEKVMNFFSDDFVGGAEMAEYINAILKATLTK